MPKACFRLAAAALAAFVALPMVAPLACRVPADSALDVADTDRMGQFEASRVRGLGEAMMSTDASQRAVVADLFSKGIQVIDTIADGAYDCRTIKMGGISPLVVYDYFDCQISNGGTTIEKTSGSQRFTGTLTPTFQGLFYQGTQHYNNDPVPAYTDGSDMNQVGCLYQVRDEAVYRLELPFPKFESTHDVIELVPSS